MSITLAKLAMEALYNMSVCTCDTLKTQDFNNLGAVEQYHPLGHRLIYLDVSVKFNHGFGQ